MQIKFNWGHGIFVFYVVFVCVLATALIASRSVDHSLVVKDYYAQDLAYQSIYEKTQNSLTAARVEVQHDKNSGMLYLNLHATEKVDGEIHFYRPSDKRKDFTVALQTSNKTVSTAGLDRGHWVLKIDWTEGSKNYYTEQNLSL